MTRTERKMGCQRRALWPAGDDLPLFTLHASRATDAATPDPTVNTPTTDAEALARYQHQLYTAHVRALLADKE